MPWPWPAWRTWGRQFGALLTAALATTAAGSQDMPEYRLKAAFIYNFAAFTEWPAEIGSTLNLCLHGQDPFGAEIDPLHGKKVGERSIAVQRHSPAQTLKSCQIVFVAGSEMAQLSRLLDSVRGLPVLTLADSAGAAHQGVMLNMRLVQGRVAFDANQGAARNARLALSSKLLRLAAEVIP